MDRICPYCQAVLKSERAYNRHLALVEESYENGTAVSEQVIRSLEKVKDRVKFLLLKYPECRRPDNGDLYIWYLRTWTDSLIYDANEQAYALNDNQASRNCSKHRKLRWAFAQLETTRRKREELQREDKALYHEKQQNGAYISKTEHRCILPSEEQLTLAEARERELREYYSPIRPSVLS